MSIVSPPLTAHFAPLATGYDVVLSDVWASCTTARSPSPKPAMRWHAFATGRHRGPITRGRARLWRLTLDPFGAVRLPATASSARAMTHGLTARAGQRSSILARDLPICDGLDAHDRFEHADYAVCSASPTTPETLHDYHDAQAARALPMIAIPTW
jgi:hypothetical protein